MPPTKKTAKKAATKKAPAKLAPAKKAKATKAATPKATSPKSKSAPAAQAAPEVGSAAPAFSLPADDGRTVTLSDLRGKNVVVYFYPRDDTPGCTKEACGFRDASAALLAKNAVVLGISKDSVASHAKFKAKYELDFTLLSDPAAETIAAYGSWGQKKFMGRTFDGILRTTVLIDPQGKVKKVYPKVSPETHAAQILEDLSA
jgi:peroxiredoxin Q/BCP